MSRWLVTEIPSWVLLCGLIVLITGGSVIVQYFVRRRLPVLNGEEHNDVTKFTYGFIGFVYAFFIGFMVSAMWGQINTADTNARNEGAATAQMVRHSTVFEPADANRIRQSLLTYEQAAIAEWSRADVTRSQETERALADLYTAYDQVQATTTTQKTFLASSLTNLDTVSQSRTVRLLTARADTGPPWPLWVVIFLTSAMVIGTAIIYGVEKPIMHYPMVAVVAVIVAANLFLVLELSHPYFGVISTTADPLEQVVQLLTPPS